VSSHLALEKTFELLDRLKSTVRTCSNRADQLTRELNLHASRLDRQIDQEIKDLEARLSSSITELDTLLQTSQERLESNYDRRKSKLLRAHIAARKHRLKVIESREGRQINDVQRELLHTSGRCCSNWSAGPGTLFADTRRFNACSTPRPRRPD